MELSSDNFSKDFLFFLALNIRKNIKDRNFEQKNINEYCYDIANGKNEMIRFTLEAMGYIANFDPENLIISITNKNDPMNTETMSVDKSKPDIFLRLGKEKNYHPSLIINLQRIINTFNEVLN